MADDLLTPLLFAVGGVSSKSTAPELCHFVIRSGYVVGYDGVLAKCSPINVSLDLMPRANELVNTIKACPKDSKVALSKTPAGKLSIKADKFKNFVSCLPDDYTLSIPAPEGIMVAGTSKLLPAIKAAIPFCADGKGPTWSQGIRFSGNKVFATNSLVLIEKEHDCLIPHDFIIPVAAAKELLKADDAITSIQVGKHSVTFYFGMKWMRTAVIDGKWPDNVEPMFNIPGDQASLPEGFFDAVKTIASVPMADESTPKTHFREGIVSNSHSDDAGASVELDVAASGIYPTEQLLLLEDVAQSFGWWNYPRPVPFRGEALRGILLGFQR